MKRVFLIILLCTAQAQCGWISTIASLDAASQASDVNKSAKDTQQKMNQLIETLNAQSDQINHLTKIVEQLQKQIKQKPLPIPAPGEGEK